MQQQHNSMSMYDLYIYIYIYIYICITRYFNRLLKNLNVIRTIALLKILIAEYTIFVERI